MSKETINDELQNLSPLLRDLKQQDDGFCLPEGYFEALEDSVLSRVARREPALVARRSGFFARLTRSRVMWAAAAVFLLVLATTWLFKMQLAHSEVIPVAAAQELTEEEIESYVLENIRDFEAEQLASLPAAEPNSPERESLSAPKTQPKQAPSPIDDLSEEELEILLKDMSEEELKSLLKT